MHWDVSNTAVTHDCGVHVTHQRVVYHPQCHNPPPLKTQPITAADTVPQSHSGLFPTSAATLLLPGVTISWTIIPALIIAVALSLMVHEAGHMMAAMIEGIPILNAGFTMIHHVLPAAHVTLDTRALTSAPPRRQMRVAGAGIVHNVVLWGVCGVCSVALHAALGQGYVRTRGAVVRYVW